MKPLLLLTLPFAALAMSHPVRAQSDSGPSYDCDKASNSTEHAICNSQYLRTLDARIAVFYEMKIAQAGSPNELIDNQKQWIVARDNCGENHDCLELQMSQRLVDLALEIDTSRGNAVDSERISDAAYRGVAADLIAHDCANPHGQLVVYPIKSDVDTARLYEVSCNFYAYNYDGFYLVEHAEAELVIRPRFAEIRADYFDADGHPLDGETSVSDFKVTGIVARDNLLVNTRFDEATETISGFVKYRGVGDAGASYAYQWNGDEFLLSFYAEDPSYDSASNLITLFERD